MEHKSQKQYWRKWYVLVIGLLLLYILVLWAFTKYWQ